MLACMRRLTNLNRIEVQIVEKCVTADVDWNGRIFKTRGQYTFLTGATLDAYLPNFMAFTLLSHNSA